MLDRPTPAIAELVRARRPGFMLPAGLYTRQDAFEADVDIFFHRHWIFVGFEADVPEPGDVCVFEVGRSSVAIIRDDDGLVQAFHNVCRHRGARLLDAGKSTVGKLVCPYHQWTYELTGELAHAPHMGRDFDRACHGLRKVNLRSVGGLLFVCLADDPPADFEDLALTMEPRLAPFDLRNAKIAFERDLVEEGNWKLTIENNRECYHCAGSHPELNVSFVAQDFGFDPAELDPAEAAAAAAHDAEFERRTADWEAMGYASRAVEHLAGHATNFRVQRLVIAGAGESQTRDTRVASRKLMGSIMRADLGDLHFWTHQSWHHYMSDHAVVMTLVPLAPDRTLVRAKWLVHKDAVEGVDYDLDNLTHVWTATNAQDGALVGRAHKGVSSLGYVPGPYSRFTEAYLDGFDTWYVERMTANGF
ncbi:MAG: aromatic ring-hydroxylating dioxygenase subunit alpha [Methylobacteriaceae bacterium]|nr:aromatic ring-hydroxylating dioxygenase subunit alpha [Methylobacteriaceae bacterium]